MYAVEDVASAVLFNQLWNYLFTYNINSLHYLHMFYKRHHKKINYKVDTIAQ